MTIRVFLPALPVPGCREGMPDTKSLADVLWSPLKWARSAGWRGESSSPQTLPQGTVSRSLGRTGSTEGQTQYFGLDLSLSTYLLWRGSVPLSPAHSLSASISSNPQDLLQALGHPSLLLLNTEIKRKKAYFSNHSSG